MEMVQKGDIRRVNALIKAGADVNKSNRNGFTPLHIAARYGIDSCIKLLVKAGADVNFCAADNYTPLIISAYKGHSKCVRELLKAGAYVNTAGGGYTALMYAVIAGHEECVNELVKGGPDMNLVVTSKQSKVPDKAKEEIMAHISTYLLTDEILEERKKRAEGELLENLSRPIKFSAVKLAGAYGNLQCLRALINAGADDAGADVNDSVMGISALM